MITTTRKNTEGHGISYSNELHLYGELKKFLPENWKVEFDWRQILFSDVEYAIDTIGNRIQIFYNQNLRHWTPVMVIEIKEKLIKLKVIK